MSRPWNCWPGSDTLGSWTTAEQDRKIQTVGIFPFLMAGTSIRTHSTMQRQWTEVCPHRCSGSQQSQVIHLVCPVRAFPIWTPVSGFHRQICRNHSNTASTLKHLHRVPKQIQELLPDCSCSPRPTSCHQVTRRCTAPSGCGLSESSGGKRGSSKTPSTLSCQY